MSSKGYRLRSVRRLHVSRAQERKKRPVRFLCNLSPYRVAVLMTIFGHLVAWQSWRGHHLFSYHCAPILFISFHLSLSFSLSLHVSFFIFFRTFLLSLSASLFHSLFISLFVCLSFSFSIYLSLIPPSISRYLSIFMSDRKSVV